MVCGTNAFRDEVEAGRNKALLEQFRRRGMKALQLPAILPASDLDKIAAAYDLPKAEGKALELRLQIVRSTGLRAYTNLLKAASKYAEKKGKAIDWCHFISAHDVFSKLDLSSGAEDTK